MSDTLPTAYDASQIEDELYAQWKTAGYFVPPAGKDFQPYCIMMPPPNRTGTLHIGHAMGLAIQDLLIRFERMRGKRTLWVPGTDHAAIATQVKVEQQLIKQGTKDPRRELGREKFLEEVVKFADDSARVIRRQIEKMGSSCDWSHEAYTLDEPRSRAVNVAFKRMFEDGVIERGFRLVNWDPQFQTTLSDDEVLMKEVKAKLYTFTYDKDFPIAISTTRPETKFGDTAVAVHPGDKRYKKFIGKTLRPTFCGKTITVKIIADDAVDPHFGTGALGVTPAHSMVDEEIATRHGLPMVQVIGQDGRMTEDAGEDFKGLLIEDARKKIERLLQEQGLLRSIEEIDQNLPVAERGGGPVEQLPMRQWFIRVNKKFKLRQNTLGKWKKGARVTLKQLMIEAVKSSPKANPPKPRAKAEKQIKIIPPQFEKIYFHWIENLRDWCISRQIWFGHRVPVWYHEPKCVPRKGHEGDVAKCVETIVSATEPSCEFCDAKFVQDPDTLDTWFSSGLWTFSTLGWPLTNIVFVRHGEARSNTESFVDDGSLEKMNDLTKAGVKQVKAVAKKLKRLGITRIISSPVHRARRTADILAKELNVPVTTDDHLRELTVGGLQGKSVKEFVAARGDEEAWRRSSDLKRADGIETAQIVKARMREALSDIIKRFAGETVVVVSHGDPISAVLEDLGMEDAWGKGCLAEAGTRMVTLDASGKISDDLTRFHPTSVLETGRDILFFWIARMILMSTYALGEVPFRDAYLHGLVLDDQGRKMSKSLENIIDPLDMIKKYGTDAVRLSLLIGTTPGQDVRLSEEKIAGFRNFTNKLWNIGRFILMVCASDDAASTSSRHDPAEGGRATDRKVVSRGSLPAGRGPAAQTIADSWILGRLREVTASITKKLDAFQFSSAGEELRDFTWGDLADWYLEIAKIEGGKKEILTDILRTVLKLWHPFMPFVTEHLWRLAGFEGMLIVSEWPTPDASRDKTSSPFDLLRSLVGDIRRFRADHKIEPKKMIEVALVTDAKRAAFVRENEPWIKALARLSSLTVTKKSPAGWTTFSATEYTVAVHLSMAVDKSKELARVGKERSQLRAYAASLEQKLNSEEFAFKAPVMIINDLREKLADAQKKIRALDSRERELKDGV